MASLKMQYTLGGGAAAPPRKPVGPDHDPIFYALMGYGTIRQDPIDTITDADDAETVESKINESIELHLQSREASRVFSEEQRNYIPFEG